MGTKQAQKIEIYSCSRLHLSLFSMHATGLRINGGIGFAIESPSINVTASPSHDCSIKDIRHKGLTQEAKSRLKKALDNARKIYSLKYGVSITISGDAGANYGFGTGTAVRLSCLEALILANNMKVSDAELVSVSGRGGTSGIGVNTYFTGGVVVDIGISKKNGTHVPSSQALDVVEPPLVLQQRNMPNWDFGICIPLHIPSLTKEEEILFFEKECPISEIEAHKALYLSITGIFASICENEDRKSVV